MVRICSLVLSGTSVEVVVIVQKLSCCETTVPTRTLLLARGRPPRKQGVRVTANYALDGRFQRWLSMDPISLGSAPWSVFWQPDVETNLVSPWFSSLLHVPKPVLESRNLKQLAIAFAFRRLRVT